MRKFLTLLAAVLLLSTAGALAQDDDTTTYTFADDTTITIDASWQLLESDATDTEALFQRESAFLTVTLLTPDAQTELLMEGDVLGLMDNALRFTDVLPDDVETLDINGATAYYFEQVDGRNYTLLYGALLDNDSVLLINGLPRNDADPSRRAAIQVLESVQLQGGLPVLAADDADDTPPARYFPDPVGDFAQLVDVLGPLGPVNALSDHTFTDETEIRFPLGWEIIELDDTEDSLMFRLPRNRQVFAMLFSVEQLEAGGYGSVPDVMQANYITYDPNFTYDLGQMWTATFEDVYVYFYRYEDGGVPGTHMGVALNNGSVLIIDTWDVDAFSIDETLTFAMLLDAAGQPVLLDQARELG